MAAQRLFGIFLLGLGLATPQLNGCLTSKTPKLTPRVKTNEVLPEDSDDSSPSILINNTSNASLNRSYHWKYGNWSSCSGLCAKGGHQTRNASCVAIESDGSEDEEEVEAVAIDNGLCQLSLRLPLQRSCDMTSCQARWSFSDWSQCFLWKGLVRTRSVSCQPTVGVDGDGGGGNGGGGGLAGGGGRLNGSVVQPSSSLCTVSEKPEGIQPCEASEAVWFTGPWSECNRSCGVGNRSRDVWCTDVVWISTDLMVVSDDKCPAVGRPASQQRCYLGSCFGADWVVSSWSGCNNSCGQRFESRLVLCVGKDGRRHPDVICDPTRRPLDNRPCKEIHCEEGRRAKWFTSDWGACSASCGRGRQFRNVFCAMKEEEDTKQDERQLLLLPDSSCVSMDRMEEERECLMDECNVTWITSSFGMCSSSCGEGQRRRFVFCLFGGRLLEWTLCNATSAPNEIEDCKLQPCPDDLYGAGSCKESEFGCCADGVTPADGPNSAGCPVEDAVPFGFCHHSEYGCCSDQVTSARGPFAEGCPSADCQDSEFGCCPDGLTASPDAEKRGCRNLCESSQYGCCPDGMTPSNGPDQSTGCLPIVGNDSTPCSGGDGLNCQSDNRTSSCHESQSGCCPDGKAPDSVGACNSSSENNTVVESSDNLNNSSSQSGYNASDISTSSWNDSYSPYPADVDFVATPTAVDQESTSGDDESITLTQFEDRNLSSSNISGNTLPPALFGLDVSESAQLTPTSVHLTSEQVGPCSAAPYGCCPDGITAAVGPGMTGCIVATTTPRVKPDLCALPMSIGDCQEKHRVWFYNATVDRCFLFHYTGCGGNANRFMAEYQCNTACRSEQDVPSSLAICVLPVDAGPCNVNVPKWHYNYELGQCQPFAFGGCEGNDNKFDTRRECEGVCSVVDICRLPVDPGNCSSNSSDRFYFSPSVRNCLPFAYGGCGGNANRFRSFRDCSIVCKQTYNLQVDLCRLPSDPGPCKWFSELFYFNTTLGTCQRFSWGGCGGNRNRFLTMEKCLESCASSGKVLARLPASRLPGQSDACLLRSDPGPCKSYQPMWYFEPTEKACRRFLYGGCGGNANLFETRDQCVAHCQADRSGTDPQLTTVGQDESSATASTDALSTVDHSIGCLLPRDPGPCIAYQLRWFFDQLEARCQQFHYGGCQGNENNYESLSECESACREFLIHVATETESDACSAPRDPGPCFADFLRYHWDREIGECRPFTFGGCQGNDNNFVTQDDCYLTCERNFSQGVEKERVMGGRKRLLKPGDCYESLAVGASCVQSVRWYFDIVSGDCLPFYYRGCHPEGNNFHSHDDCISFCLKVTELCGIFQCDLECDNGHSRGPDGCLQCQCNDPCETHACADGLECHLDNSSCTDHPCQPKPICMTPSKSGDCPIFADNWSEVHGCKSECKRDVDCAGTDKCCYTGCGRICAPLVPSCANSMHGCCPDGSTAARDWNFRGCPEEAPSIEDNLPSVVVATAGSNILFPCKALGAPLPQINWFRNGNPIVAGWLLTSGSVGSGGHMSVTSDGSLVIRNVTLGDAVPHTCRAFNTIGSATREYTVVVQVPVRIVDIVPRDQTVREGRSVRFECITEGEPVPVVTWYRDNEPLNETGEGERLRTNGSILTIEDVVPEFQGMYECVASNYAGVQRQSVTLRVLGFYYVNITMNSSGNLTVGSWLHLLCNISGAVSEGDLVISWTKDGNPMNQTTDEFVIDELRTDDSGEYSCKVRRGEEEVEAFVDIQVIEPPEEVPEGCIDKPWLADCELLIQASLCHHPYYGIFCCRSCFLAGKKLPR